MKEIGLKLMQWYANLDDRERRAVLIGSVVTLLFLGYTLIFAPVYHAADTARTRLVAQQKTLAWMQAADRQLQQAGTSSHAIKIDTPVALLSFLQNKTKQAGLTGYVTQLKQANDESIVLTLQKVSFDRFMQFMLTLLKEQPLVVTQLAVTPTDTVGWVNIEMNISV